MKKFLFVPFILISLSTFSQTTAEDHLGAWWMYFGTNRISDKFSIHTEAQLRLYEPFSNFFQFLPRTGLNYHLNKTASVTAGYAWIPTSSYDKGPGRVDTREHRIWQQLILKNEIWRLDFEHRYRIEQRWVSNGSATNYLNRVRYRLFIAIPLNRKTMADNTVFLALYDEVFLNINDSPFDQNRLYAALGYKLNNLFNVQAGYLRHRAGSENLDRLQLAVFINPDFRKKEE